MEPIGAYLRGRFEIESVTAEALRARVVLPADLQGPPRIAHGGAVAALLLETAERHARETGGLRGLPRPLRIDVTLARAVPLDASVVALAHRLEGGAYASRISRPDGTLLAEAQVAASAPRSKSPASTDGTVLARAGLASDPLEERAGGAIEDARAVSSGAESAARAAQVPGASMCLACGPRNPRGLHVRLEYDASRVWKRVTAPSHWREADGSASPALALVLLDEIGWWLGALACGECGLSTRLAITLGDPVAADAPLRVVGARARVVTDDPRRRVWRSRAALLAPDGRAAASAEVAFAGGPAFTKSMAADLFDPADLEAARRLFPRAEIPARENTS